MILQGTPTVCFATARPLLFLFLLTVIVVIDVYPLVPPPHLKRIRLTHQHACTHARCCLSAGKISEITVHVDRHAGAISIFNGESSRVVFPPRVYPFHFISPPLDFPPFISHLFSSFALSLHVFPLAHKPAPWPSCGLDHCG